MIEINCNTSRVSEVKYLEGWLWGLVLVARHHPLTKLGAILRGRGPVEKRMGRKFRRGGSPTKETLKKLELIIWEQISKLYGPPTPLPKDAVERFLGLPNEPDAACDFLLKYGLFREKDKERPNGLPETIDHFWTRSLRQDQNPFALRVDDLWDEQENLRLTMKIHQYRRLGDEQSLQRAHVIAEKLGYGAAGVALSFEFSNHLGNISVGLDVEDGRDLPRLSTHWVLPGLYAQLWNSFVERRPWGQCLKCGRTFVASRPKKQYCSGSCEQAAKQQRYRERKMKKSRKRGK